jgi:hypothetical protein
VETALHVLAILLVAVALAPALAHALEFPGKLRLAEREYLVVQPIYYPGFTFAGIAEPVAVLVVLLTAVLMPFGGAPFWLCLAAFAALAAMHAVYWLVTHPVNKFWLKDTAISGAGNAFFATDAVQGGIAAPTHWTTLRDRWEYSHVVRAGMAFAALALIAAAVAIE